MSRFGGKEVETCAVLTANFIMIRQGIDRLLDSLENDLLFVSRCKIIQDLDVVLFTPLLVLLTYETLTSSITVCRLQIIKFRDSINKCLDYY